jgi:hypothetical protein
MVKRQADNYPRNINTYVPLMQFSADINNEQMYASLGAPATLDADGILAAKAITTAGQTFTSADFPTTFDGSSTSLTRTQGKLDAVFGRCLTLFCSGGNTSVVTITGRDYLGQPMAESFTCNGATTVQGKKAFKYVDKIVNGTGGSSVNLNVGWSDTVGLPLKSLKLRRAFEDGVPTDDEDETIPVVSTAFAIANAASATVVAPVTGFWVGWRGVHTTASTTAISALTGFVNGVAKTAADGTEPIAANGLLFGKDIAQASWIPVVKGDSVTITSDGGSTAGVADMTFLFSRGVCEFNKAINTNPQTLTTGDPRGTYKPATAFNGVIVHEVHLVVDITNLHGVAHVIA